MRLFLVSLLVITLYQCAGPQGNESYIELREGMTIKEHNGKTVMDIRMVGDRYLTVFFTDGSIMRLEIVKYHVRLLQ